MSFHITREGAVLPLEEGWALKTPAEVSCRNMSIHLISPFNFKFMVQLSLLMGDTMCFRYVASSDFGSSYVIDMVRAAFDDSSLSEVPLSRS
jgi:hypothetical protein